MNRQRGLFGINTISIVTIAALFFAVSGYLFIQKRNISKAEAERDQAIVQRNQTAAELQKAIDVARTNSATIEQLKQDQQALNESLNQLEKARVQNTTTVTRRTAIVERQASLPANQAVTAPVIADVIADIQDDREKRRGTTDEP